MTLKINKSRIKSKTIFPIGIALIEMVQSFFIRPGVLEEMCMCILKICLYIIMIDKK